MVSQILYCKSCFAFEVMRKCENFVLDENAGNSILESFTRMISLEFCCV